jgi:hypothetical protein
MTGEELKTILVRNGLQQKDIAEKLASQQQKSDLIGVVSTSQKQIEQLTNIIDRLTQ